MIYLIFAGFAFLFLLALDIFTSPNAVEGEPVDANGMPGDFPTREDLEFMELITDPIERGEA